MTERPSGPASEPAGDPRAVEAAAAAPRELATVQLRLSPHPSQVRTARLLAVVLGRRRGLSDATLDELRLAVGETCSRAVRLHQRSAPTTFVVVDIEDTRDGLVVVVTDVGPFTQAVVAEPEDLLSSAEDGALAAGTSLALVTGLVEDVQLLPSPGAGTSVRMSWPIPDAPASDSEPVA